ncbi:hypothetical protein DL96DRAFT_17921 [Flagelloscypha sp. PMI_526]|nr:hypothetical protein DL96DRAFT_17921 [Flagelloscypha sp. PMI_526]
MKTWGYCKLSIQNGSPAAPTNLPQAAPNVNRETMVVDIITAAVQDSIELAVSQRFNDGNHRTALLSLLETVTYAGLHITPDVDIFRLYINLKSLTEKIGLIDRTKRKVQIVLNPTPEQKEKQDADIQKATKEFEDNKTLVKGEMVKLMKDVVRISPSPQVPNAPITFLDRMGLIHMAKFYVPIQVKEVGNISERPAEGGCSH